MCYGLWYNVPTMLPAGGRQHRRYIISQAVTQSSAPEDGQNNCPKHVELTGIIIIVASSWLSILFISIKQMSDNDIYFLIEYIKSLLWRVVKCLSYIRDARWLKVKGKGIPIVENCKDHILVTMYKELKKNLNYITISNLDKCFRHIISKTLTEF